MPPRKKAEQGFKREQREHTHLPTPESFSSSTGTLTPKQEHMEVKIDLSNKFQDFNPMNDGLARVPLRGTPIELDDDNDEGYGTQSQAAIDRKMRSASPSLVSQQNSSGYHPASRFSLAPSMASMAKNPGASLQLVGAKVNLLVDAIEELRQLGLKEINTELPELVLVGDQSAGKSTLMGAIAEINLPKDKGMCTRCPANIKTAPADTWSCSVSLHEYYHFTTEKSRVPTKAKPFPPWVENADPSPIVRPFKTISKKEELENILKWAQVALLNPTQDHRAFIPGSGSLAQHDLRPDYRHEADFSPNLVAIEISGPGLPALSFYDLPGIFASSAHKDEKYLIKVFENLAGKYIKHENALIICAITMQNDPGLSRTAALIGELKAERRTIGVLTMPDRLQDGSTHKDYDAILKGTAHVLPHGYFVTKQPGPGFVQNRSDYHQQARDEEDHYFDHDERWTGEWSEYRERCGTAAIQKYLSQEFARMIVYSMPNINDKINEQALLVEESLARLPELPNQNVQHVVRRCLGDFSSEVQKFLDGGPSTQHNFSSSWANLAKEFGIAIQWMKPIFIMSNLSEPPTPIDNGGVVVIDSDDETIDTPTNPRKHTNDPFTTPNAKRFKTANDFVSPSSNRFSATPSVNGDHQAPARQPKREDASDDDDRSRKVPVKQTAFGEFHGAGRGFMKLRVIRSIILNRRVPGHPDSVSEAARQEISLQSIKHWNRPLQKLADIAFRLLKNCVIGALDKSLSHYSQTLLYKDSRRFIIEFLELHFKQQRSFLDSFYELEIYKLYTINDDVFKRFKADELKVMQERRRYFRAKYFLERKLKAAGKTESPKDKDIKAVKDEDLGPDPFAQEVDTAAYVVGYYRTAGARFADNLTQNIQGMLFRKVKGEIPGFLERLLGLDEGDGEARCRELMVEDRGEARQRASLQEEKRKLTQARERLEKLTREYATPEREQEVEQDENGLYGEEDEEMDGMGSASPGGYRPPRVESEDPNNMI